MRIISLLLIVAAFCIGGCAETSPILKARESKSFFEGAVYSGESTTIDSDTTDGEQYRVFQQAATGFISLQTVREECEQRASIFCRRQGKGLKVLQETTSPQIFAPGNFPRAELIFTCIEIASSSFEDQTYIKLSNLKKLLDNGTITKDEFEQQKAKILGN